MWNFIRQIFGFLLPVGKGTSGKLSPAVAWTIHIVVVVLILLGLFALSEWLHLYLAFPNVIWQPLAHVWLPLVALAFYLLLWVVWWLWKVWLTEEVTESFADIEDAWKEAVQALDKAGVSLTDVPLFLVVGRTEAAETNLFQAARLDLVVKQTPGRADAPLHVYASRESIYVTCANISLLGQYASMLALEGVTEWPTAHDPFAGEGPVAATGTLVPGVSEKQTLSSAADSAVAEGRPGTALERRSKRRLLNLPLPNLRKDRELLEETAARLKFLCGLIARDRQPFCPVNGLLLLLPLGSTDSDEVARQAAELCQRDLVALRRALRMRCPVFVLVCDLETTWGFYEFVQRQKPESKMQRLGQRFPLAAEIDNAALREYIDSSVQWLGQQLVREWIYHLFQAESDNSRRSQTILGNVRLYRLLEIMHRRQTQLGYILKTALLPPEEVPGAPREPWFFGGCYVAATGADKDHEQAFVRGVLDRLNENQEFVCWTEETLQEDMSNYSQTRLGYIALAGAWTVALLLVFWRLWR